MEAEKNSCRYDKKRIPSSEPRPPDLLPPHSQQNDKTVSKGRNGKLRRISRSAHDVKVCHQQRTRPVHIQEAYY
eukprot:6208714-Pleurochrysis_carterae.AAC.1